MQKITINRLALACLAFTLIATFIVWYPVLFYGFVWDDNQFIKSEPYLHNTELFLKSIQSPFFVSQNYYRPLPLILLYAVGTDSVTATPYHALLLVIHLCNTALLFLLISVLMKKERKRYYFAVLGALLFSLNPDVSEIVAWISGIFDGLFAMFAVALLLADLVIKRIALRFIVIFLLFLCAALTKEMAAGFVFLLPLWHGLRAYLNGGRVWIFNEKDRLVSTYFACFVAGIVYLVLRYSMLGFLYIPSGHDIYSAGIAIRIGLTVKTIGYYVTHVVYPFWDVAPVNPVDPKLIFASSKEVVYFAVGAGFLVALWLLVVFRSWKLLLTGLIFLAAMFPVLHILPMSIGDNFAHLRFLYFPLLLCSALLIVLIKDRFLRAEKPAWILSVVLVLLCLVVSRNVMQFWVNDYIFWHWAREVRPESATAKTNYYAALASNGQCDVVIKEALPEYQLNGATLPLLTTIASCFAHQGDVAMAEAYYADVMSNFYLQGFDGYDRRVAGIYLNLATMYLKHKPKEEQIVPLIDAALEIEPDNIRGLLLKGRVLLESDKKEEAREYIDRALEIMPAASREQNIKQFEKKLGISLADIQ